MVLSSEPKVSVQRKVPKSRSKSKTSEASEEVGTYLREWIFLAVGDYSWVHNKGFLLRKLRELPSGVSDFLQRELFI